MCEKYNMPCRRPRLFYFFTFIIFNDSSVNVKCLKKWLILIIIVVRMSAINRNGAYNETTIVFQQSRPNFLTTAIRTDMDEWHIIYILVESRRAASQRNRNIQAPNAYCKYLQIENNNYGHCIITKQVYKYRSCEPARVVRFIPWWMISSGVQLVWKIWLLKY